MKERPALASALVRLIALVTIVCGVVALPQIQAACFDDDGSYCDSQLTNDGWFTCDFELTDQLGRGVFATWMKVFITGETQVAGSGWEGWTYSPQDPNCQGPCGIDFFSDENGRMVWADHIDNFCPNGPGNCRIFTVQCVVSSNHYPCYVNGASCSVDATPDDSPEDAECVADPKSHATARCIGGRCTDTEELVRYGKRIETGGTPGTDIDDAKFLSCDADLTPRPTITVWEEKHTDYSYFDSLHIRHRIRQPFPPQPNPSVVEVEIDVDDAGPIPKSLSTLYYGADLANPSGDNGSHGAYDNTIVFSHGFDGGGANGKHTPELRRDRLFSQLDRMVRDFWNRGIDVWLFVPSDGGQDLLIQAREAALATHLAAEHVDEQGRGPIGGKVSFVGLSAGGIVGRVMLARWTDMGDPFLTDLNDALADARTANGDLYRDKDGELLAPQPAHPIPQTPPVGLLGMFDTPSGGANVSLDQQKHAWAAESVDELKTCAAQQMLRNTCWHSAGPSGDENGLIVTCDATRATEFYQGGDADGNGIAGVFQVHDSTRTCGEAGFAGLYQVGPDGDGYPDKYYGGTSDPDLKIIALSQGNPAESLRCYKDGPFGKDWFTADGKAYDLCPQTSGPTAFSAGDLYIGLGIHARLTGWPDRHEKRDFFLDAWDVLPGSRRQWSFLKTFEDAAYKLEEEIPEGLGEYYSIGADWWLNFVHDSPADFLSLTAPLRFVFGFLSTIYGPFTNPTIEANIDQYNTFTFVPVVSAVDDRACLLFDEDPSTYVWWTDGSLPGLPENEFTLLSGPRGVPAAACSNPSPIQHAKIDNAYINSFNAPHQTPFPDELHFQGFMVDVILQGRFCDGSSDDGVDETECDGFDNDGDCLIDEGLDDAIPCQHQTEHPGLDENGNGVGDIQEIFEGCLSERTCTTLECPSPDNYDTYYVDRDGDGYGIQTSVDKAVYKHCDPDVNNTTRGLNPIGGCSAPRCTDELTTDCCGYVTNKDDCDDTDTALTYGSPIYDDLDDDGQGGAFWGYSCFSTDVCWLWGTDHETWDCQACNGTSVVCHTGCYVDPSDPTACLQNYSTFGGDCRDDNPDVPTLEKFQNNNCSNGIDDDCDGYMDAGEPGGVCQDPCGRRGCPEYEVTP